ncbi:protein NRT1/ PTR FAMILY 3.1-like [Rhodamnia argentea]|uniref:Protein NRT1/ PTR FAMILY 3.1-like n=1 Tax=Rhodamnia argentea TaxID=178133 RepID=A0A8B8QPW3_9MYRT|nr:protein NRT1/ PTR FAMILY 3.1-like [Rhodamnia argentea]
MEEGSHGRGRKKGGMVTMPFIFSNEVCDKLAVVGFNTNMLSYLTAQLHMPLTKAANTVTSFGGTASLTPLIGAFVADAYAGRFWTVSVASIIYVVGMTLLTVSAVLPQLRPPPCEGDQRCQEASGGQLAVLYTALLLGAIGSGGIRPCVVAFGADQFDPNDPKQSTKTWKYFNWYYFVMGVSILLAVTVLVYIQDYIGWGWGLGIPTFLMFLSVITLIGGYRLYRMMDPAGSPFTRLLQVCVASFRKRRVAMVTDSTLLYENEELDASISLDGKLVHTNHVKFLDKAAIVTPEDDVKSPNVWRLNTVHRVEELKTMIRMGPIWASGIILYTAYAQQSTFSLQQAKMVDRHLGRSFQIPAASMSVFTMTAMLLTIAAYDRLLVPVARRFTGLDRGISFLKRMGIGYFISILATLVAGFVEVKRKHYAKAHGLLDLPHAMIPMSVFWLMPQYALHGIAEAFMAIGHLEFFYDQAPESMRSTATALFWTSISAGNYLSTLMVSLVHKYSAGPDGSNWLPDSNLNRGKLEYFYWVLTLLQALNLLYYVCVAKFYTMKPVQVHTVEAVDVTDEEDKDKAAVELAKV